MTSSTNDLYQRITDQMVEQLEAGVSPWQQPWRASTDAPRNAAQGYRYRGVNVFMLILVAAAKGYEEPYWLTFNQAKKLGGSVKKGEKGTMTVFWKLLRVKDKETGEQKTVPLLRYATVFNIAQTEGVKVPRRILEERLARKEAEVLTEADQIEAAVKIVDGYDGPTIRQHRGSGEAYYVPATDVINVPALQDYDAAEKFYGVLFHEMAHSTGHKDRLDRFGKDNERFGSHAYGREELVAEMTAAFLAAEAGITTTHDNSAAYLASWVKVIKEDTRAVVVAAGAAQKAADLILGRTREDETADEEGAQAAA